MLTNWANNVAAFATGTFASRHVAWPLSLSPWLSSRLAELTFIPASFVAPFASSLAFPSICFKLTSLPFVFSFRSLTLLPILAQQIWTD